MIPVSITGSVSYGLNFAFIPRYIDHLACRMGFGPQRFITIPDPLYAPIP